MMPPHSKFEGHFNAVLLHYEDVPPFKNTVIDLAHKIAVFSIESLARLHKPDRCECGSMYGAVTNVPSHHPALQLAVSWHSFGRCMPYRVGGVSRLSVCIDDCLLAVAVCCVVLRPTLQAILPFRDNR